LFKREKHTVFTPPPDKVILCPECNGTVDHLLLHSKRGNVLHFATFPCEHIHDTELLYEVMGREKEA
jgi:hypothetical protein